MDVVLAAMTDCPYRGSVAAFAGTFAAALEGRVRVVTAFGTPGVEGGSRPRTATEAREPMLAAAEVAAEREVRAAMVEPGVGVGDGRL